MKLIQTKDYLLLIDEEAEIKINDLCLIDRNVGISTGYEILACEKVEEDGYYHFTDFKTGRCSKIIAYYPLNSEAKELDLPLLPNPFEEEPLMKQASKLRELRGYHKDNHYSFCGGFIEGYKAAQSKQFSLEDMKKAIEMAREQSEPYYGGGGLVLSEPIYENKYTEEEIIQSLSTQQLPKEFIPEYDLMNEGYNKPEDYPYQECKVLKTITNSEGREVVQGKWIY